MSLDTLPPLREVIAAHGLAAKKSLGQNFLLDANLLDRIARIPGPLAGHTVYEIGPGPGGLTRALLRAGATVIAVERDDRALPALAKLAAAAEGRLTVLAADALALDAASLCPPGTHIVANLPYNIGTALLARWLEPPTWPPFWASLTLMFQKEVAARITAAPGSAAYGRLSVLCQWRTHAATVLNVSPKMFVPAPKVSSAVVHLTPMAPLSAADPARLSALTAAGFGQRRKMLRASLRSLPGALEALEAQGIAPEARAETVPVAAWAAAAALMK